MANVEEAQFESAPYPKSLVVYLNRPAGYSRDSAVLRAEATELVRDELADDEFIQGEMSMSCEAVGERTRWQAHVQINQKKVD
ncbi:hypothetical protein ACX80V_12370 [Arthrobacter sp. MDT3-24]